MNKDLKIAVVALLLICLVVVGVFVVKSFNSEQKDLNISDNIEGIASAGSEKDNPVDKTDNSNESEGNGTDDSPNNTNDNTSDDNKDTANNEAGNDTSNTSESNTEASNASENSGSDEAKKADESNQGSAEDENDEVEEDANSDENSGENADNSGKEANDGNTGDDGQETNDGNTDEGKEEDEGSDGGKRDRLEGAISRPINNKDVIEGEKYEGVQRGVIKTSAYNPLFKDVEGDYLITSEEELTCFKMLVMDEKLSKEFSNIEFDKYTLVISEIESKTSSLIFQVNGLIVGENNIAIDSIIESQGMTTSDMARFYPYVLIEKDKLTKDAYEGWRIPSEVEQTNVR